MGSRVILKPSVYRYDEGYGGPSWVAELDHITWQDWTAFDTWEAALEHALWLGACASG